MLYICITIVQAIKLKPLPDKYVCVPDNILKANYDDEKFAEVMTFLST